MYIIIKSTQSDVEDSSDEGFTVDDAVDDGPDDSLRRYRFVRSLLSVV